MTVIITVPYVVEYYLGVLGAKEMETKYFRGNNIHVSKRKPGKPVSRGVLLYIFASSRTCLRGANER